MKKIVLAAWLLLAGWLGLTASAALIDGETLFEENFKDNSALTKWRFEGGNTPVLLPNGNYDSSGNALRFAVSGPAATSWIMYDLDPATVNGMIAFEAYIRGDNLKMDKAYEGPKLMLVVKTPDKTFYPEPQKGNGSFDWVKAKKIFQLPKDTQKLTLCVGIQNGTGVYTVSNIRICRVKEVSAKEAAAVPAPVNLAAAKIPRGDFAGTNYRGVMSGSDLSSEAFSELKRWNANLMRYQLNAGSSAARRGFKGDTNTPQGYLDWIDFEIAQLDRVLESARQNGIKIVIDLHSGPGTKISAVSSNILAATTDMDTLEKAWIKLAGHYQGNPQIYGYDLLNEPVAENYLKGTPNPWKVMAERMTAAIRTVDPDTPVIVAWHDINPFVIDDAHVIYSPHFYSPHALTHYKVGSGWDIKFNYPGQIDGIYWDKEQMRVSLKNIIEFQKEHKVKVYVGEFGCSLWVQDRDLYLKDCIELFEEYGWDWTYHAYREWPGWSVEHALNDKGQVVESADNPAKQVLLDGFKKNVSVTDGNKK